MYLQVGLMPWEQEVRGQFGLFKLPVLSAHLWPLAQLWANCKSFKTKVVTHRLLGGGRGLQEELQPSHLPLPPFCPPGLCPLPASLWAEGTRETTEGYLDAETGARPTEQNLQVRDGGRELTFT